VEWTLYLFQNTTQIFPWVGKPGFNRDPPEIVEFDHKDLGG
jgi:hypothetical protein